MNLQIVHYGTVNTLRIQSNLEEQISQAQKEERYLNVIKKNTGSGKAPGFRVDEKGTLWYKDRICVPKKGDLRQVIMDEVHYSAYSIHPGATKMFMDLRSKYWWRGMKRDIAEFVAKCDICRRVKAEHQRPAGLLQPLHIPVWKFDEVGMDFVVGLSRTPSGHNTIWVIVDRLTKVAHFIPVSTTYTGDKLAQLYIDRIVKLHGAPSRIVSNRYAKFTSRFWKKLHEA